MEAATFEKGNITVHTENIFPIIKKSLYSDHEIFLRELVSNAVDATQKLKYVISGEDTEDTTIRISFDKDKKTITISDRGIGMTLDEVKKYINQVAFSGAEEFVKKFTEAKDANAIIGRFGLGFYSAFMVADSVEILTKSFIENSEAVLWTCDGSTEYTIGPGEKAERGTDIILHVSPDSEEFLDKFKLNTILEKYCKFLPAKVEFEGEVISNHDEIWKKAPAELTDEDYQQLHRTLYPLSEDPLFWIHLNVDFPFTLNGILFFPKQKAEMEALRKDRINLYSRGVFITDKVEDIVPEYLLLLQGVIESPDIPLNVSRSFLQADSSVKKISSYITRKVAEKLNSLYESDRKNFEEKWPFMEVFVRYGMISDEKFYESGTQFALFQNLAKEWKTIGEMRENLKEKQTDKNENLVLIYATEPSAQDTYIKAIEKKGYEILQMNGVIDQHYIEALERKEEKLTWKRVDSDSADKIIEKDEKIESPLSEDESKALVELFETIRPDNNMSIRCEALGEEELPMVITRPEFMRRMKEMSAMGGGMKGFGDFPEHINAVINASHPLAKIILDRKTKDSKEKLGRQMLDLARLSQGMLSGPALSEFIQRSISVLK